MAQPVSRDKAQSGADAPIRLRRLRTESEFRETTRGIERREREKYSSMLWNMVRMDLAPKVQIMDLVGNKLDGAIGTGEEGSLRSVVDFYHKKPNRSELMQILKFFSVYLIQRARRETTFTAQQFLLFKAIDLLRNIVHYATWSVHGDAEGMVYAIIDDMDKQVPGRFAQYAETEHHIYIMMKKLQRVPRDFPLRIELGDEFVKQTSFFDALVQFDFLNRFYPRFFKDRNLDLRLALIYAKITALFQDMIDHIGKGYRDARKLNSFIERYNREFGTRKVILVPIRDLNRQQIAESARSLRIAAEVWYRRTLALKMVKPQLRTECAHNLARNLMQDGRWREAHALLTENYRYWSALTSEIEGLEGQVAYLDTTINAAVKLRRRDQVAWANGEQREARMRLDGMVKTKTDYNKRRDEIKREAEADDDDEDAMV